VDGFLNINKPIGITSYDVIRKIKKKLKIKKVGHAGNLDPNASGVLVVGIGTATRFLTFITDLPKEYIAEIKFGKLTDTLDATGEVLDRKPVPKLEREKVERVLRYFLGEIDQVPPSYSAVRVKGKRLYELARSGILVQAKPKRVTIYSIELLELMDDRIKIRTYVSRGTYIRSLARDIGYRLGTYGIVNTLMRTRIGHFVIEEAVEPDSELEKHIIPPDVALSHMPQVYLREHALKHFLNGNRVSPSGITRKTGYIRSFQLVRVYDHNDKFLGVGVMKWEGLFPKRLLPVK